MNVERKKKDEKNKKIVNKKDLLENIDYYLKKYWHILVLNMKNVLKF